MELTELLKKRRSVRRFDGRVVPHTEFERIIELALTAPSSKGVRSTRFMVIDKPELLARIAEMRDSGSSFVSGAPCGVLVMGDSGATDLWVDNASISAMLLQLAAEDAGLGSCWVHINGRPRRRAEPEGEKAEEYLRTFLPIPEGWRPLCFVAVGYPAEQPRPHREQDDTDRIIWL